MKKQTVLERYNEQQLMQSGQNQTVHSGTQLPRQQQQL